MAFNPLQVYVTGGQQGTAPAAQPGPQPIRSGEVLVLPSGPPPRPKRRNTRTSGGILSDATNAVKGIEALVSSAYSPLKKRAMQIERATRPESSIKVLGGIQSPEVAIAQAIAPYIELDRATRGMSEAGRTPEDKRGAFLRRAYESYTPTEGYYAMPRSVGGNPDPNMFDGLGDQSQIDNARRKFVSSHKWARNTRNAADVDVAVRYLLQKKHKGYM